MQDATTTFATWLALLHGAGVTASDPAVAAAVAAVFEAEGEAGSKHAGAALVAAVGQGTVPELAERLLAGRAGAPFAADDRAARLQAVRRYGFAVGLPWLAQLVERHDSGEVTPHWVILDHVTDVAHVVDPNPWDDILEDRELPVGDLAVLWELTGCAHVAVVPG